MSNNQEIYYLKLKFSKSGSLTVTNPDSEKPIKQFDKIVGKENSWQFNNWLNLMKKAGVENMVIDFKQFPEEETVQYFYALESILGLQCGFNTQYIGIPESRFTERIDYNELKVRFAENLDAALKNFYN